MSENSWTQASEDKLSGELHGIENKPVHSGV